MKERPYHHGDLRHALIETGIDFVKQKANYIEVNRFS